MMRSEKGTGVMSRQAFSEQEMAVACNESRRTLLGASALGCVTAQLGSVAAANAQASTNDRTSPPGTAKATFGRLKHVNAGVLSIAYAEAGPENGPPVL